MARQRCQRHNEVKISSNTVPPPVVHRAVQSSDSIDLPSNVGRYFDILATQDRRKVTRDPILKETGKLLAVTTIYRHINYHGDFRKKNIREL